MRFTLICLFLFLIPNIVFGVNLNVPFTSQAPEGNWRQPWQDTCEEASIVMVDNFYQKNINKKIEVNQAKKEILQILKIKEIKWGKSLDENAEQVVKLINNYLPWEAKLIENPSLDQIKNEIDNNQPVIIPVYGKTLKNKNFKNGGPIYHMLVISGFDNETQEFITEEPGTRNGLDFRYSFATIMSALHDYLPYGKTAFGPKIAIFTSKEINGSGKLDADNDGLTKEQEFNYGSITWLNDSDGDGYADGFEVLNGYSPTKKLEKL
ncbi:MAG: von Willebrand factor type A [Candidatus Magasanikbacteria bacterium GW2011_GWC2_37_14]|uniref:von Willebrand factor type A n=1 Tax=Candidatus Magasanikbacteria bacterium GW2011_GWC2_37_14 TaxID=1619046 RepID=A0A0G0GBV3_9BACT|nr:MAG: von Willebrand factor type A [Candidatus Magasanikbacteria bacterium GW2011_GWC2_37_14]